MNIELAQRIKEGKESPLKVYTKKPLFNHELVAASFSYLMRKSLILDEMGVGKTLSTIGALSLFLNDGDKKVVIFAPSSIMSQWADEISKFLDCPVIIVEGSTAKRKAKYSYFAELKRAILITNYSIPIHDYKTMSNLNFDVSILDESTFVKSPETKIYSIINSLHKNIPNILLLTGTPITLSLGDLYWLFNLLNIDGILGSFEEEVLPFLNMRNIKGRLIEVGASDFNSFTKKLDPYCIRRTLVEVYSDSSDEKAQFVKNKPELVIHALQYSKAQADLFLALKAEANRLSRENNYEPLKMYQKFLQVCSSTKLLVEGYQDPSPKELYLLNKLKSSENKVVVFVRYLEFLKCLQNLLDSNGIRYNTISGKLSNDEREYEKKQFLNSDSQVLFITGAGKYGLNLQIASELVFMDVPYNPADILQIMNRIYRYGQMNNVTISIIFLENTIEEDIFRKLYKRQSVLDEYFKTTLAKSFKRNKSFIWGFLEKDYNIYIQGGDNDDDVK